jgi:predicted aminopeptidase
MDVYVAGARAYSTIGWFDDPLLNTMLYRDEAMRVGILFHELAHQQLYVQDDTAFNEAFATVVAQEGVRRWFLSRGDTRAYEDYLQAEKRRGEFHSLLKQTRENLQDVYFDSQEPELMRTNKQAIIRQLKVDYQKLKAYWDNDKRYDAWMAQPLNNAHLALVATYHEYVPAMKAYLDKADSDLLVFYQQMEQLAGLPIKERHQKLGRLIDRQNSNSGIGQ